MKGFGGMQQLMKQANQMQNKMKKAQEEFKTQEFSGTAGGGAVSIRIDGDYFVKEVQVSPELLKDSDVEMVQDLILTATNDAMKTAKEAYKENMDKVTGGVNIPGFG